MTSLYIHDSFKARKWLTTQPYEWHNQPQNMIAKYEEKLLRLPKKCADHFEGNGKGVFGNWKVLLLIESALKSQAYKRYFTFY